MIGKDNGGPAFPCDNIVERNETGQIHGYEVSTSGITTLDYFAAKVIQGIYSNPDRKGTSIDAAEKAYEVASALILVRNRIK